MKLMEAAMAACDRENSEGWDRSFLLIGSVGSILCEWIDPHRGVFCLKGRPDKGIPDEIMLIRDFTSHPLTEDIECVMPPL